MVASTLDLPSLVDADSIAKEISRIYNEWSSFRNKWIEEKKELRNYVFATDTKTTTNKKLPWANSTITPKLAQIYDNLKANYSAALFPRRDWTKWEARDKVSGPKAKAIKGYLDNKMRQSGFEKEVDTLLDDFILFGNCFGYVDYVSDYTEVDGEVIPKYIGPKLVRISPFDIVFNPSVTNFKDSPKIIRSIVPIGTIKRMAEGGDTEMQKIFEKVRKNRRTAKDYKRIDKTEGYIADGFSSIELYYGSGYVEILTFYGTIYDMATDTNYDNRKITVVDRAYMMTNEPIPSWLGEDPVFYAGWRSRPDNLYAMGPLDNLVGMQYRIDHLENLKSDVFDQIALPMMKIKGDVENFEQGPGARIIMGEEGDVGYLQPDPTALQADFQIQALEEKMEEMAGAPRQAMGIRTPGEKTAFEVQSLENSASRLFQHKASKFEREFLEPVLNAMLEAGRRNLDVADQIRVFDTTEGVTLFMAITKEDITANGRIIPVGARHFAERAQRAQQLNQLLQLMANPAIGVHISGKAVAKIVTEELGEDSLFGDNIQVKEQMETQDKMQNEEVNAQERQQVAAENGL